MFIIIPIGLCIRLCEGEFIIHLSVVIIGCFTNIFL